MGIFGSKKVTCDCCNQKVDETKDVCKICWNTYFGSNRPIQAQVMDVMDKKDLDIVQDLVKKQQPQSDEGYLDLTKVRLAE